MSLEEGILKAEMRTKLEEGLKADDIEKTIRAIRSQTISQATALGYEVAKTKSTTLIGATYLTLMEEATKRHELQDKLPQVQKVLREEFYKGVQAYDETHNTNLAKTTKKELARR